MTQMEKGMNEVNTTKLTGQLELKNITFRYDETQPYLFENINYTFQANESIAITGSSGVGKTTLLKIMIGLFKSDQGKIEDNGRSLTNIGLSNYRNQISAVMQDDQLMSGSIMDNICFFSTQPDIDWLEKCAKLASIHDEILQMPMGYNSLVGDMGTSLSGGQKQRILLARALYKKPKILFMDEATSHLDTTLEAKVNYALNQLDITRIIIAHRPETINNADKILLLKDKKLIEMNKQ
jgi:ATP-binding cassette subfamily B protein RaxB